MNLFPTKPRRLLPGLPEDFFNGGAFPSPLFGELAENGFIPDANIIENGDSYQIEIAAPGLDKKDFKVELHGSSVAVSAEKKEEKEEKGKNFMRKEFSYSSFSRSFALPENLVPDKIDAKYENGILRINLPKKQGGLTEFPKQIKVG